MCHGTESFGFQCNTPGPGVITNPECYNPNRTAGVQCITSEYSVCHCSFIETHRNKYSVLGMGNISILPYNIIVILTAHDNRIVVVLQLLSYHFCIISGTFIPN